MKTYFIGKLSDIIYRMSIHEGDANRRLASEAEKIFLLHPRDVPKRYQKDFDKLRKLIEETFKSLSTPGITPCKLKGIRNSTASKYIKLLLAIQSDIINIE